MYVRNIDFISSHFWTFPQCGEGVGEVKNNARKMERRIGAKYLNPLRKKSSTAAKRCRRLSQPKGS